MLNFVDKFRRAVGKGSQRPQPMHDSKIPSPNSAPNPKTSRPVLKTEPTGSVLRSDIQDVADGSFLRNSICNAICSSDCQLVISSEIFVNRGLQNMKCNIFLSCHEVAPPAQGVRVFSTTDKLTYECFCDDFGPMNFLSVIRFIGILDAEINALTSPSRAIVYCSDPRRRHFTNAAFLLGAYMILKLDQTADDVWARFGGFDESKFEGYRDATYSEPTFRLRLIDCWRGLERAKSNGWIALPSPKSPAVWGQIDAAEYERYDSPLDGDLHEVVPGKFVAFKGPKDLPDSKYADVFKAGLFQARDFDPRYYADIFREIGVTSVIRLNDVCYRREGFVEEGIEHHDLCFEDCTSPPTHVVSQFFAIADRAKGKVAIHCKAGLGRTGTLIALAMMRTNGFTAREAIGWLRIVRPGSVIGEQQAFLCAVDSIIGERAGIRRPAAAPEPAPEPAAGQRVRFRADVKGLPAAAAAPWPEPPPHAPPPQLDAWTAGIQTRSAAAPEPPPSGRDASLLPQAPRRKASAVNPRAYMVSAATAAAGAPPAGGDGGGGREGGEAKFTASARRFEPADMPGGAGATPAALAAQVAEAMDRRAAALIARVSIQRSVSAA